MKTPETIKTGGSGQEGFVLILALVTMLAMTLIGLSVIMSSTTDLQLARNDRDAKLAFQLAEAGINEASARLHLSSSNARYVGEISGESGYRTVSWNAANALGKDFGYNVGGNRNSAENLNYTVNIRYLVEGNPENYCDSNNTADNAPLTATVPPASCPTASIFCA